MNKSYKVIAFLAVFALVIVFTGGAALADTTAQNQNTGYESENKVEATVEDGTVVVSANQEVIVNDGSAHVNTGGNEVEENTGSGSIESGALGIMGLFQNVSNMNMTQIFGDWLSDLFSMNGTTGAESENEAETEQSSETEVTNSNDIYAHNSIHVNANTGDNESEENTAQSDILSGDIMLAAGETNIVNGSAVQIGVLGGDSEDVNFSIDATNVTTGADSENEAEAEAENEISVDSSNLADIMNHAWLKANTGGNESEENTGPATVESGDAEAMVAIMNELNYTSTTINIDPIGAELTAGNSMTGHKSENEAEAEAENEVEVNNANLAAINNFAKVKLNTGDNEVSENTGIADLTTGEATANVTIENGSAENENATVVNIDLSDLMLQATNYMTGADSENEAKAKFENEVSIGNSNETAIVNCVEIKENTGDNEVSKNTGPATLTTGDADATATITNDVNYNTTQISYNPVVDITLSNSQTGAESENKAKATVKNEISVDNTNSAEITNNIESKINTGGNEVSGNTGSGNISTGGATVIFGSTNSANGNVTQIGG